MWTYPSKFSPCEKGKIHYDSEHEKQKEHEKR